MDEALKKQLHSIAEQIEVLYGAEEKYLSLDAATDHLLARLATNFDEALNGSGKTISEAAATRLAKQNADWVTHKKAVAIAEADFHRQKHLLELKNSAFQALYLSLKVESDAIRRGVG